MVTFSATFTKEILLPQVISIYFWPEIYSDSNGIYSKALYKLQLKDSVGGAVDRLLPTGTKRFSRSKLHFSCCLSHFFSL